MCRRVFALSFTAVILGIVLTFAGAQTSKKKEKKKRMELKSAAFTHKGNIPQKFTCDGADVSPELSWSGAPQGTKSFVMIMDDPDAPPGTWVHWVLYDLPGDLTELREGLPKTETLQSGAKHGLCWGVNKFDRVGYYGPCPPPGKPHRYFFKLYALDKTLGLPSKATKDQALKAMQGRILSQGELVGTYGR